MTLGTLWLLGGQFERRFQWESINSGFFLKADCGEVSTGLLRWDVIKITESRAIFRMGMGLYMGLRSWPLLEALCRIRGSGTHQLWSVSCCDSGPAAGKSQQGSCTFSAACPQLVAVFLTSGSS